MIMGSELNNKLERVVRWMVKIDVEIEGGRME